MSRRATDASIIKMGIGLTLAVCLLTYVAFAGFACFVTWSGEYWSAANWDEPSRAFYFLICLFWVARGVWATSEVIREAKE